MYYSVKFGQERTSYHIRTCGKNIHRKKCPFGKKIYPFATNGGWLGHTLKDIAAKCKGANVKNGLDLHFNDAKLMTDKSKLESWIKNIK